MTRYIRHFSVIFRHKMVVMWQCFMCGQFWLGLIHDNSKFGITEFASSAKYFQGTRSPIDAEKEAKGYSIAWQHHKGHNPHHWEYWIDNVGERKNDPIKMPYRYVVEMMCDWIGAGKIYESAKWEQQSPYNYHMRVRDKRIIHPETEALMLWLLGTLKDNGMKAFHCAARVGQAAYEGEE